MRSLSPPLAARTVGAVTLSMVCSLLSAARVGGLASGCRGADLVSLRRPLGSPVLRRAPQRECRESNLGYPVVASVGGSRHGDHHGPQGHHHDPRRDSGIPHRGAHPAGGHHRQGRLPPPGPHVVRDGGRQGGVPLVHQIAEDRQPAAGSPPHRPPRTGPRLRRAAGRDDPAAPPGSIDDPAYVLETYRRLAAKYPMVGPEPVELDDAALEAAFGRFASKNTAVVVEPDKIITWDHTKLGGAY